MHNLNSKQMQKEAANKSHGRRVNLRVLAQQAGVPEFMVRFAQRRRIKILRDEVLPKYRYD